MYAKTITVRNASGLHARPASAFIAEAKKYESAITIRRVDDAEAISAKSMVKLLTLGIGCGQTVELAAQGTDEQQAVEALAALIEGGFEEI